MRDTQTIIPKNCPIDKFLRRTFESLVKEEKFAELHKLSFSESQTNSRKHIIMLLEFRFEDIGIIEQIHSCDPNDLAELYEEKRKNAHETHNKMKYPHPNTNKFIEEQYRLKVSMIQFDAPNSNWQQFPLELLWGIGSAQNYEEKMEIAEEVAIKNAISK